MKKQEFRYIIAQHDDEYITVSYIAKQYYAGRSGREYFVYEKTKDRRHAMIFTSKKDAKKILKELLTFPEPIPNLFVAFY